MNSRRSGARGQTSRARSRPPAFRNAVAPRRGDRGREGSSDRRSRVQAIGAHGGEVEVAPVRTRARHYIRITPLIEPPRSKDKKPHGSTAVFRNESGSSGEQEHAPSRYRRARACATGAHPGDRRRAADLADIVCALGYAELLENGWAGPRRHAWRGSGDPGLPGSGWPLRCVGRSVITVRRWAR